MKCFVWQRIEGITSNWHDCGGLLIVAKSLKHAQRLLEETVQSSPSYPDPLRYLKEVILPKPDCTFNLAESHTKTKIMVFPDAGCC